MGSTLTNSAVVRFFIVSFLLLSHSLPGQDWELRDEEDGIKVYTRPVSNSDIRAVKVETRIEATLSQLAAVILDIPATGEWVYATKECRIEKTISPTEYIYYSELEVPWPVSNRDFIVRVKVDHDPATNTMTVSGENLPAYLEEKPGVVRVMQTVSTWTVVPEGKNLNIEFVLHVNPGGSIPAWLVNLFVTQGPKETFLNLRSHVKKPKYQNASFPFIVD
jgi:hypothetical protein